MKPIHISVPEGAQLTNQLYPTDDPNYLSEDLVTIALPTGYIVDVGWYPDGDPTGAFFIRVFWQYWDNQVVTRGPVQDPETAALIAEGLAWHFAQPFVHSSQSDSTNNEVTLTY